ncbi:hypothetical protein [Clostridium sp.]|uniref:hypothetical protein n=1 Tax=Clostridium sp. TaxID=1506 RepID=UPI00284D9F19|nr:hypothetical protein [Clostridium sp.]MDR3595112.1 hypothetical protein [Clostridium sp.]
MYSDDKKTPKQKVRTKIDTILISDTYGQIGNIIIDALSERGFEIDIVNKNIFGLPPKQELNIYQVVNRP